MKRTHPLAGIDQKSFGRWLTRASALFMICGVAVLFRLGPFAASSSIVMLQDVNGNDSGWAAWIDASLDPFVDVSTNLVDTGQDAVFIHLTKEFRQGSVNGVFPSIPIVFAQMNQNAVSNIVIDDETIVNNTGQDWTDFHMSLMDHGDARFDADKTANSGGTGPIGFSLGPFTQAQFVPDSGGNLTTLNIFSGVVPTGTPWFPGSGANDGQLWISVNTEPGSTIFTLLETPTMTAAVPLPASAWMGIALLGGGAVIGVVRRRIGRQAA